MGPSTKLENQILKVWRNWNPCESLVIKIVNCYRSILLIFQEIEQKIAVGHCVKVLFVTHIHCVIHNNQNIYKIYVFIGTRNYCSTYIQ